MSSNSCFYIQSVEHPDIGLVSDVGNEYKSVYQLLNVDVHHLTLDNDNQKWSYDENTRKLTTLAQPGKAAFAGANNNVVLFEARGLKNQLFTFNEDINSWYNEVTKHSVQLGGGHNAIIKQKFKNEPEF